MGVKNRIVYLICNHLYMCMCFLVILVLSNICFSFLNLKYKDLYEGTIDFLNKVQKHTSFHILNLSEKKSVHENSLFWTLISFYWFV